MSEGSQVTILDHVIDLACDELVARGVNEVKIWRRDRTEHTYPFTTARGVLEFVTSMDEMPWIAGFQLVSAKLPEPEE